MNKRTITIYPTIEKNLKTMGEQIKLARLRRELSVTLVCERADISRSTLWKIEKGDPSISIGAYVMVLHALGGLDKDILYIAKDDETGRLFQDLKLKTKKRINK